MYVGSETMFEGRVFHLETVLGKNEQLCGTCNDQEMAGGALV